MCYFREHVGARFRVSAEPDQRYEAAQECVLRHQKAEFDCVFSGVSSVAKTVFTLFWQKIKHQCVKPNSALLVLDCDVAM